MKDVRIGVLGVGVMGERHCRVCANLPHVQLIGVSDRDQSRGIIIAERYETNFFDDVDDLLSQVDAAVIATTTPAHFLLAEKCAVRGIHAMVEKPLTETTDQAERLVRLARENGIILQVGHIERFNPAYIELKRIAESMTLIGVDIRRLSSFDSSNKDVDVVKDLMIHDLDLIMDLIPADIEELSAWGRSTSSGATDHAVATVSFKEGPIAVLSASRCTEQKVRHIGVTAKEAYIEADLLNKSVLIHRRTLPRYLETENATQYRQESVIECIYVPSAEPLALEMRHFANCVREHRNSDVPGSDGLRALQLAELVQLKVNAIPPDDDARWDERIVSLLPLGDSGHSAGGQA